MDKNKRTDLLAAGRKKLQQYRQKKDQKGGGKSSGKGGKAEKEVDVDDSVKFREPEHSESAVSSSGDVNVSEKISESERDTSRIDSGVDEVPVELPESSRSSLLVDRMDGQAVESPGLERCDDQSLSIGSSVGEDGRCDDDSGIVVNDPDPDADIRGTGQLEGSHGVVGLSDQEIRGNDVGDSLASASENAESRFVGAVDVQGNEGAENSGLADPDTETPQDETGISAAAGPVNGGEVGISLQSKDAINQPLAHVLSDSITSLDQSREYQVDVGSSAPVEESELTPPSQVPQQKIAVEQSFEVGQITSDNEVIHVEYPDVSTSGQKYSSMESRFLPPNDSDVEFEGFKRHLCLTVVARDVLQLQLDEQSKLSAESSYQKSNRISELSDLVNETQEMNSKATEDLAQCRSELESVTAAREDLEVLLVSKNEEIEVFRKGVSELESKLESSQKELLNLSAELAVCRGSLDNLHRENLNLCTRLTLEEELRKATVEEKNILASENSKLSSELLECRDKLHFSLDKQNHLAHNLRESSLSFEQLLEENFHLYNSSIIYKLKIEDLVNDSLKICPQITGSRACSTQVDGADRVVAENLQISTSHSAAESILDNDFLVKVEHEAFSIPIDLKALKEQLKEAKNTLQTLEKAVQDLHLYSVNRLSGKVTKSGVSNLIKAFESKNNVAESSSEEMHVEGGQLDTLYATTKMQTSHLSDILVQMELDIQNFEVGLSEEWQKREHSRNIELDDRAKKLDMLQAKVDELVQELLRYKSKVDDVQIQFDVMQKDAHDETGRLSSQVEQLQNEVTCRLSVLKEESKTAIDAVLGAIKRLNECIGLHITDDPDAVRYVIMSLDASINSFGNLQKELDDVNMKNRSLNDLYMEANNQASVLEQKNDLAFSQMYKIYLTLLELLPEIPESCGEDQELNVNVKGDSYLEILFEKYERLVIHLKQLLEEHHLILSKNYELEESLLAQKEENEYLTKDADAAKKKLVDLRSVKDGLESLLVNKTSALEEVYAGCLALVKKLDNEQHMDQESLSELADGDIVPKADMNSNSFKSSLLQVEALINKRLQTYDDIVEQINLSKDYLLQVNIFPSASDYISSLPLPVLLRDEFMPRVREQEGHVDWLFALNIKYETECQILKDFVVTMERSLEASYSELQLKSSELEQSEQRLSSVREKLSIAVSKGKGLVAQRDSLKQSLNEKSSELEKLSQELQSKENYLREIEAKLKSHTEVGRVEALESELSYIRNSATALRDSFLLKDSILQRIEEVLEELDLPEHFHSKEIVEKVELLSRLVVTKSSFTAGDSDKKASGGRSHSDGDIIIEGWKDDSQEVLRLGFAELKSEYEELERKFNYLVEENDLLQQSLVKGNNFVHKLEEVLATINFPTELRLLQPEYKIEWLRNTLFEVEQERDTLLLKTEELERKFKYEIDEMLKQSLVERNALIHKLEEVLSAINVPPELRLSQPEDKIQWVGSKLLEVEEERDAFGLKIEELDENNDILKQSLVEWNSLVHKLEEVLATTNIPLELRSLQPENKIEWLASTLAAVEQERDALQLKVENLETSSDMLVVDLEESQKRISELRAEILATKSEKEFFENSVNKLRFEYDGILEKVIVSEIDRDIFENEVDGLQEKMAEKEQQLHNLETGIQRLLDLIGKTFNDHDIVVGISGRESIKCLEDFLLKFIDEYRTLITDKTSITSSGQEVETSAEREFNVSDINQQELIGLRLELQEAFSSIHLVKEERDEARERNNALIMEMEELHGQQRLLQEAINNEMEKYQMLMSDIEQMHKERDDVLEKLTLEEQKSVSVREKLNVAVRKGKALVQQRDSLKQSLEEMSAMVDQLKSEKNQQLEVLESEKLSLVKQLEESEQKFDSTSDTLSKILTILHNIDVDDRNNNFNPVQKLEENLKLVSHLRSAIVSYEQETQKYKKAAELLIAELNEAQERSDFLQEELERAEAAALHSSKLLEIAEAVNSEEKKKQIDNLAVLTFDMDQLKRICFELSGLLTSSFNREVGLFHNVEAFMESFEETSYNAMTDLPSANPWSEEKLSIADNLSEVKMLGQSDNRSISEQLSMTCYSAHECVGEYSQLKIKLQRHTSLVDQHTAQIAKGMELIKLKLASQEEECEYLKKDLSGLEQSVKDKENEILLMRTNLMLLYQACIDSIAEMKSAVARNDIVSAENISEKIRQDSNFPSKVDLHESAAADALLLGDELIRSVAHKLLSTTKDVIVNEKAEGNMMELKTTVAELQRELQEKDVQMNTVTEDLVSQIRNVEAVRNTYLTDLESARARIDSLEKQNEVIEMEKKKFESKANEFETLKALSYELEGRVRTATDVLTAKDQEIEALMQALDEEEMQMENLVKRNSELEKIVAEKNVAIENLEASRVKILAKLSTTVNKFDELHNLSESLLTEVESLQSQVQSQDSEISFLRQEVTRCTNELLASQDACKKYSSAVLELLKRLDTMVSRFGPSPTFSDDECSQIQEYTALLDRSIASAISELDDLRVRTRSMDAQFQTEKVKAEELSCKYKVLETSLREKEIQIRRLEEGESSSQLANGSFPGTKTVEPMKAKSPSGAIVTHVRSGRKVNGDQIAIAIDEEKEDNKLEDEDDDKAHGFKSLVMSRFIPRFTRPLSDRIDGMWVSGDRLLMRQPVLRLGVLIYWVALHALLASLI